MSCGPGVQHGGFSVYVTEGEEQGVVLEVGEHEFVAIEVAPSNDAVVNVPCQSSRKKMCSSPRGQNIGSTPPCQLSSGRCSFQEK